MSTRTQVGSSVLWSTLACVPDQTGGTDFYPSGYSLAETMIVTVLVVIGAGLWTMVLATFCDVPHQRLKP